MHIREIRVAFLNLRVHFSDEVLFASNTPPRQPPSTPRNMSLQNSKKIHKETRKQCRNWIVCTCIVRHTYQKHIPEYITSHAKRICTKWVKYGMSWRNNRSSQRVQQWHAPRSTVTDTLKGSLYSLSSFCSLLRLSLRSSINYKKCFRQFTTNDEG
jgi:hypothetical protein